MAGKSMTHTQQAEYRKQRDQQVIEALDALDVRDPEVAHTTADELLLSLVSPLVRAAYDRTSKRAQYWATA